MSATVTRLAPTEEAASLTRQWADASAQEILGAMINDVFKDDIALVSSFGAESAVLLHLVANVAPNTPVLFIDTGQHFAQTPIYRRKLAKQLGLTNIIDVHPDREELLLEDPVNNLWQSNQDGCCTLRKVRPLDKALVPYRAWVTGRKQFHGGGRLALPVVEHKGDHFKVNPIVTWSQGHVEAYRTKHDLPPHPLVAQGFPSIGCWPCTHPVAPGGDVRDGRWRGQAKTECGIHQS